jgi:hypothetical protein
MEHSYEILLSKFWTIQDAADDSRLERLKFHLEQGDYFPFLATVVGFLKETAETCRESNEVTDAQMAFTDELRKDLIYLHENYQLAPKATPLTYSTRKMVRFDT